MLQFWRMIFYSKALNPIFVTASKYLHATPQVCKEYCTSGLMMYGPTLMLVAAVVVALLFLVKLLGFVNPGNYGHGADKQPKTSNSPLNGKNIIFLGSSVTKGFAARGTSFVDMIAARTGAKVVKEASSGTTLVDNGEKSYIARLKKLDKTQPCDLFVCQLSTNDATKNKPLGKVAGGKDLSSFDTRTVCGAIEYIIAYAKETWNAPVVFYTSPEYASPVYAAMVDALDKIAAKWGIQVIDLWNDREINDKKNKGWTCMNDQIHPTRKGYEVWTPVIEAGLAAAVQGKSVPARPKKTAGDLAGRKTRKLATSVICWVLVVALAFLSVVGSSTYIQLVNVKGLKNEGNSEKYFPENVPLKADTPIAGKHLLWVGSSVFQGLGSRNHSPALWVDAQEGTISVIDVKAGTFLAGKGGTAGPANAQYTIDASGSYIARIQNHDTTTEPEIDLVMIQLSTNDSKGQTDVGEVSDSFDFADFDYTTTVGALEAIAAYARDTWNAPVLVVGGSVFEDETTVSGGQSAEIYMEMIDKCHELDEKWGDQFNFLDLWHNDQMYVGVEAGGKLWRTYMSDSIHPTMRGYLEWWGPYIEDAIRDILI